MALVELTQDKWTCGSSLVELTQDKWIPRLALVELTQDKWTRRLALVTEKNRVSEIYTGPMNVDNLSHTHFIRELSLFLS